jgi:hypothetical protein
MHTFPTADWPGACGRSRGLGGSRRKVLLEGPEHMFVPGRLMKRSAGNRFSRGFQHQQDAEYGFDPPNGVSPRQSAGHGGAAA